MVFCCFKSDPLVSTWQDEMWLSFAADCCSWNGNPDSVFASKYMNQA